MDSRCTSLPTSTLTAPPSTALSQVRVALHLRGLDALPQRALVPRRLEQEAHARVQDRIRPPRAHLRRHPLRRLRPRPLRSVRLVSALGGRAARPPPRRRRLRRRLRPQPRVDAVCRLVDGARPPRRRRPRGGAAEDSRARRLGRRRAVRDRRPIGARALYPPLIAPCAHAAGPCAFAAERPECGIVIELCVRRDWCVPSPVSARARRAPVLLRSR